MAMVLMYYAIAIGFVIGVFYLYCFVFCGFCVLVFLLFGDCLFSYCALLVCSSCFIGRWRPFRPCNMCIDLLIVLRIVSRVSLPLLVIYPFL